MRRSVCWPSAAAAATAAVVLVAWSAAAGSVDGPRLSNLIRQDCGSCHGLTLKGGLGRPLTPQALADWEQPAIEAVILDGVAGTPMPPWRPLLSPAEAAWIAQALKSGRLQ